MERRQITVFVLVALFAALIAAGAFIRIPFIPVPITLQTLFALLSAAVLPPLMSLSSVIVYLVLGGIGDVPKFKHNLPLKTNHYLSCGRRPLQGDLTRGI